MTPTAAPPVITDLSQLDPDGSYTYADYLRWQFSDAVERIRETLCVRWPVRLVFPKEQVVQAFVLTAQGEYQLVNEYDEAGPLPSHTLPELHLEWADVFAGV